MNVALRPIDWRAVVRWALTGTVIQVLLVAATVSASGGIVDVIAPGTDGPAEAVIRQDFPDYEFRRQLGHDGQQYYAIARSPFDLDTVSESVPRTRYVMQRIAYPLSAWLLHPSGGGEGLVWAMFIVGVLSVALLAVATGAVASALGATPMLGAVAALLPGTNASLQVSTPDTMALALAMACVVATVRRRPMLAAAFGALAILSKESIALAVVATIVANAGRRRWTAALALAPAALWWVVLRMSAGSRGPDVNEIVVPLTGFADAYQRLWANGEHLPAAAYGAVILVAPVLLWWVGRSHPLWWVVAAQLPLAWSLGLNSVGPEFNGTRIGQPVVLMVVLMVASRRSWLEQGPAGIPLTRRNSDDAPADPAPTVADVTR